MSSLETVQSLQRKLLLLDLLSTARLSKSLPTFATQMEPKNIVHFFKCMDSNCDYTTNNSELFLIHLSAHWEHSFLCTYCTEVICNDVQLVQHMVTHHGARVYQCALCFFRSRTKSHLIVHSMSVHKSRRIHGYFCSKVTDLPTKVETADSAGKSYVCFTSPKCRMRCFSTERFLKHLKEAHLDATLYTCHKCWHKEDNPEGLISHYAKVHNFMSYQCLYCNFGCDNEWPVMEHIAQEHADYPFKLLIRSSQPPDWFKELNTLTKESKLDGFPNGVEPSYSSTEKCPSPSPPCSEVDEKPPAVEDSDLPNNLASSHTPINEDPSQSSAERFRRLSAVEGLGELEYESMAGCSSALPTHFACQIENCSLVCNSAIDFIAHIEKEHAEITELSCPNCSILSKATMRELFVHVIDNHTSLLRCPYSSCSFVGEQQDAIDEHIIAAHLRYEAECPQQEEEGESCSSKPEEEEATNHSVESSQSLIQGVKTEVEDSVAESTVTPEEETMLTTSETPIVPTEWLSDGDIKNEKEICDNVGDSMESSLIESATQEEELVNVSESVEGLSVNADEVYVCNLCCQSEMDALVYFRHMSLGHGVKYFCGHCEKGYKMPKQLLIHHSKFHDDKDPTFKTFQDNSLMVVPQKIISLWQQDIRAPKGKGKKNAGKTVRPQRKIVPAERGSKSTPEEERESSEVKSDTPSPEPGPGIGAAQRKKRGRRVVNKKDSESSKASEPASNEGNKRASLRSLNEPLADVPKTGKSPKKQSNNKVSSREMEDDENQKAEGNDEAVSPSTGKNVSRRATPQTTPMQPLKQNSQQTKKRRSRSSAKKPKSQASSEDSVGRVGKSAPKPVESRCDEDGESSKQSADDARLDETKFRSSQANIAFCPNNLHVCVYCYRSYKVLRWALHHQKAMHPDQPPMVKQLDFAKLDEVIKEGKSMIPSENPVETLPLGDDEQQSASSSAAGNVVVPHSEEEANSFIDGCGSCPQVKTEVYESEDVDSSPEVEEDFELQGQKNRKWRRISLLSSDSGDEEEEVEEKVVGFSYYGIKMEPIPTENIFVYVQSGGVRLAYSQLASLLNLHPRVVLQKIDVA